MVENYFIIGDVHGCFFTFEELISHWDREKEILIQVGDLIDRGAHSPKVVSYCRQLDKTFPDKVHFLKGNHEQMMLNYFNEKSSNWLYNGGMDTFQQFESQQHDLVSVLSWMEDLPLFFETDKLMVSHAGITDHAEYLNPDHPSGILWNRGRLKPLGKIQVIGHTPLSTGRPAYNPYSQAWNIDTGAYKGICLTGIKLDRNGTFLQKISIPTREEDLNDLNY
ncbi:serine/threonine protein phosphatase [Litoribacter ruber]|uniref:Serine/threonine protein phosphatase n=1 Tax=Litoribacter ruber TaxID=702568 RepID=A0AAP2G2P9_9BACT|nr:MULTISPECIES: metallophosphoesterase family protein [Litoribacter]MBS9522530.1 serine/threonine protein phosphatase [Litoribacter alkaliphilus]MBT0811061.1 serine/threonine protein phosphatase [Litoribacter ruber]